MIVRLMVIMKDAQGGDVRLGLLNSIREIPQENLDGIQGNLDSLDATALQEEAVLFALLQHKLPHIMDDAGKILDGGKYIDPDGIVAENAVFAASKIVHAIRYPDKNEKGWEEIEADVAKAIAGCSFLPLDDGGEEKVIEFKAGRL